MKDNKLTGYPSIDKPWMKFYQKDTILSEVPECTVYQNLYNHNKDYPNDIALMYFGKKITYAQLFAEVENTAKAFAAQGVKSGDNVALCVPATPETMYAILALNKLGANANMLNPTFTAQQLTDRINETDAVNELHDNDLLCIVLLSSSDDIRTGQDLRVVWQSSVKNSVSRKGDSQYTAVCRNRSAHSRRRSNLQGKRIAIRRIRSIVGTAQNALECSRGL